jgi:hypothetical protein
MDKEIEAFRNEVMHCRKNVNQGQRRYSEAIKAKALQLLARLRKNGVLSVKVHESSPAKP